MKVLTLAAASLVAGCGYSVGGLVEHRSVYLPIFGSESERRGHEFDLHRAVRRELTARGVRVNDPSATVELRGKILDITEPAVVEGSGDVVVVGSVSFSFQVELVGRSDGKPISRQVIQESASFTSQRSESPETARQEVIDRIARRVVTMLEKEL